MARTRTVTAGMEKIRELAILARDSPEGITFKFTVADHGSMEEAGMMARRFQTTFCSMRSADRRSMERIHAAPGLVIRSQFDDLSAHRSRMRDNLGWTVSLFKASSAFLNIEMEDVATGNVIVQEDASVKRRTELYNFFQAQLGAHHLKKDDNRFTNPFDQDAEEWLARVWPEFLDNLLEAYNLTRNFTAPTASVMTDEFASLGADDLFGDEE